jgi:diguanylate cyclase (GGDEF)-like protein/PAS domain S-box-containing protein
MTVLSSVRRPGKYWAGILLLGLLLGLLVAWLGHKAKIYHYQQQFERQAESGIQLIAQNLSAADAILDALVGLHQAGDEMDPYLFTPFSEKILQEYPFIQSMQYLSYISDQEKDLFISEMQHRGFSQFKIHSLNKSGNIEPRAHYLVTSFIEPLSPRSAKFMGLEWISSHTIQHEIKTAINQNSPVMIKAPEFMQSVNQYLLLKPTYFGRTIPESPQQRREQLSGLFLILFDWQRLTGWSSKQPINSLAVEFKPLFKNRVNTAENVSEKDRVMHAAFYTSRTLQIANGDITIVATSDSGIERKDQIQILLWVIACLAVYFLIVLTARRHYLDKKEKQNAQMQLFKEREQAEVTLQSIADGVITIGVENEIIYINPVAAKLCHYDMDNALGRQINECVRLVNLSTNKTISDPVAYFMDKTQALSARTKRNIALNVEGSILSVDGNASRLVDTDGRLTGYVLVLRDVSLERQLTNDLVYQASHDALTGLVNRLEFDTKLREVLELSRQQDTEYALCYLDMDQFKLVNDTCGHNAGDELLKQVAGLLLVHMREDDFVARLGGDEFGVLINLCNQKKAEEIAERIRQCLNDYHFTWEDKIFDVSASIGLVMINSMSGNLSDILSCADLACYAAKDAGRNVVHLYHADDEEISQKFSQMQWLPRIKQGLRENEFKLAVQKISSIQEGAYPASICEFLIRWPQADGSLISPAIFLPSAERYDMMGELDRWVIKNAIQYIPQLEQMVSPAGSQMYTINLSGQSIGEEGLSEFIWQLIVDNNVNPEIVCFEVTETVAIANFSVACDFINQLRDKGCRFALDDFGSGLSSFGYLKRLPLDFLKIDGLFVRDMLKDPVDHAMVRTIYDVAQVLNLKTIAEWVEDEEVCLSLQAIGVDYVQGFYLDKPQLVDEFLSETLFDNRVYRQN